MNWWVFAIFAYLFTALQAAGPIGLSTMRFGEIDPQFVLILAVLPALYAPTRSVVIACFILGLLIDLTASHPGSAFLIGPYALGYLAAAYVALQLRNSVMRQHPMTYVFMTVTCGVAVLLVVTGIASLRALLYGRPPGWSAFDQLITELLCLAYTAAIGFLVAIPMLKLGRLFGFHASKMRGTRFGAS